MKKYNLLIFFTIFYSLAIAQEAPLPNYELLLPPPNMPPFDTNAIYTVVDEMPRFYCAECEALETDSAKYSCAKKRMLEFLYSNIRYVGECRDICWEGSVVMEFIVNKIGKIVAINIRKGIGLPCADEEALRVVTKMSQLPDAWVVGKKNGNPVDVRYNIPIRFK